MTAVWKLLLLLQVLGLVICDEGGSSSSEEVEGHDEPHWSYHGTYHPANWYRLYSLCSRSSPRQSPIDLQVPGTVFDRDLDPIYLNEIIDKRYESMKIVNNGHSVNVEVPHEAYISGGSLPGDGYRIAGVHFHWGSTDRKGSEHTVMGKAFPLEMHMVSYDTDRHNELGEAVFGRDSLAVLGTMFQISKANNTLLDPIIEGIRKVQESGSDDEISHFNLGRLLPAHTNKYFRYPGSLTTPPCAESVVWTLFLHTQTISSAQLKEFRSLLESPDQGATLNIQDNWRPVQPLQTRVVSRSFMLQSEVEEEEAAQAEESSAPTLTVSLLGSLVMVSGACSLVW